MKMQADRIEGRNAVQRHSHEGVIVNGLEYRSSVIVPWQGEVRAWPVDSFDALAEAHFAQLAEYGPEIVIFGSGPRIRFAKPALLRTLIGRRIGVETMDSAAACRTYNVLLAEGRSVLLAALFEPAGAA
jgi:uncharacterized protein